MLGGILPSNTLNRVVTMTGSTMIPGNYDFICSGQNGDQSKKL